MGRRSLPPTPARLLADADRVFGALAHSRRRHILVVLRARGGRMTAGDIARRFSCSWPTTTRHLRVLLDAGLVRARRRGRERVYSFEGRRLASVAGGWLARMVARPRHSSIRAARSSTLRP